MSFMQTQVEETKRRLENRLKVFAEHPMLFCADSGTRECRGFCTKCHTGDECPGPCAPLVAVLEQEVL